MLELKFVKESPGIPQVRVDLHCSVEPFSGLGYFPLTPEQPVEKNPPVSQRTASSEEHANLQALQLKGSTDSSSFCSPRKETADFVGIC